MVPQFYVFHIIIRAVSKAKIFIKFVKGAWRKIIVDDLMPFDMNGKLLLPATTCDYELWPLLLTKALIKIAAIE